MWDGYGEMMVSDASTADKHTFKYGIQKYPAMMQLGSDVTA